MSVQYFSVKLIPPRPNFNATNMTAEERRLMGEHQVYLRGFFDEGKGLIYGPVMASPGWYGMAVMAVDNEQEARRILDADPTVVGGMNTYELFPMMLGGARGG